MPALIKVEYPWERRKPPYGTPLREDGGAVPGASAIWAFNEGAGNSAFDATGKRSTGTLNGGSSWSGQSLKLNGASGGSGGAVTIASAIAGNLNAGTGDFSIVADVVPNAAQANGSSLIAAKTGNSANGWQFKINNSTGQVSFQLNSTSFSGNAGPSVLDGKRHSLALVISRATNTGFVFVDGVLVSSPSIAAITGSLSVTSTYYLGGLTGASNFNYFGGLFNYFLQFPFALTAAQVQQLYANPYDSLFEPDVDWLAMPAGGVVTQKVPWQLMTSMRAA